jgi:uncharacterized alkaline shock family protein YloU
MVGGHYRNARQEEFNKGIKVDVGQEEDAVDVSVRSLRLQIKDVCERFKTRVKAPSKHDDYA